MGGVVNTVKSVVGSGTHIVQTATNTVAKAVSNVPVVGSSLAATAKLSGGVASGQSTSDLAADAKSVVAPIQQGVGALSSAGVPVGVVAAAATGDPALAGIGAIGAMPGSPTVPQLNAAPSFTLPTVSGVNQTPFFPAAAPNTTALILPAAIALGAVVLIAKGRKHV